MTASYRPDRRGMAQLLNSDGMLAVMEQIGLQIMHRAEDIAPVGGPADPHSGRYRESFKLEVHKHGGATHDRAEAVVSNTAPEALFVEYGSYGPEPYHVLFRAAMEGFRL